MSESVRGVSWRDEGAGEADATLRLIAAMDAPHGLEDRMLAGALAAPRTARVLAWPGASMNARSAASGWLRSAAAAAIVCVVAGGGWGIYSRVQPLQASGVAATPVQSRGGFSTAGDVARPHTLEGPAAQHQAPVDAMKPAEMKPEKRKAHAVQTAAADKTNPGKAISGKAAALPAAPVQ
jgi:hypothetical protein